MAVFVLAAVIMPWLAGQKRRWSAATGRAALRADAAESAVCGYLVLIALAGMTVNAIWGVKWADPVAALALVPFILHEGWETMKGKPLLRCTLSWGFQQGARAASVLKRTAPEGLVAIPGCPAESSKRGKNEGNRAFPGNSGVITIVPLVPCQR